MDTDKHHVYEQSVWKNVRALLNQRYGDDIFSSWFSHLHMEGIEGDKVMMSVPSPFVCEWIKNHYWSGLLSSLRACDSHLSSLSLQVRETKGKEQTPMRNGKEDANDVSSGFGQATFLDGRFTFKDFIVGQSNELACAAAQRVADMETPSARYNPLFLYGGVGLGKTHLMHAIAWQSKRQYNKKIIYMTAENFIYQFVRALRFKDTMEFKAKFRSVDILMIDDFQFITKAETTQEEFFHTFNSLIDGKRQLVISADKSPDDLEGVEDRMRSRLGWGMVAYIHPASYELRLSILQSKASRLETPIPMKVLEFIAQNITANVRVLEGALNRLVAHADIVKQPITIDVTCEALQDMLRASSRRLSVEQIQKVVCNHYNIKMADMVSSRRAQDVVRPRQVAMYLAKAMTSRSLPDIGRQFGKRDHTTVLHAVRKIDILCKKDSALQEDVTMLRRKLGG
ncbi:MAG: chromosomal replication initiator protein DnaA [Alphaproteobacteria bacterium GM7ARS4]|nr:chromosomal replication initiator protein DnaA [Alphaproteobacteria bacterium GM7ARS4]